MSLRDPKFAEFINGKSIAVVGRAEYLRTIEQGALIDSYDLVFRLRSNTPYPDSEFAVPYSPTSFIPDGYHKFLGARVDCFIGRLAHQIQVGLDRWFAPLLNFNCKWLVLEKIYNAKASVESIDYVTNTLGFNFHQSPQQQFENLSKLLEFSFPLPGTLLIYDLLHYDVELYITGFACYQDIELNKRLTHVADRKNRPHHPMLDAFFLRALHRCGRIQIDPRMQSIFDSLDNRLGSYSFTD